MTYEAFKGYVADVLARLVKVCIQRHMTSARALGVMRWAHTQTSAIWDSFEADEDVQDVAEKLFGEFNKSARKDGVQCAGSR